MALTDNLISFWELEEASGTRADSHGSNHLTESADAVAVATGKVGNGADFEGANGSGAEHLFKADVPSLSLSSDQAFTIQAWFNAESDNGGNAMGMVSKYDLGSQLEYVLWLSTGVTPMFRVYDGSGNPTTVTGSVNPVFTGTWYCVHAWHDPDTDVIGIAFNAGTPVTAAHTTGTRNLTAPFVIGAFYTGGVGNGTFDGVIDQVGFWKRVLTGAERTQLYNGGAGLSYAAMNPRKAKLLNSGLRPHPFAPGRAR
jgi:hypothetical protein